MSVFWERFSSLAKAKDGSPNKTAQILGLSSGSITAWSKGTIPATIEESLLKIWRTLSSENKLEALIRIGNLIEHK